MKPLFHRAVILALIGVAQIPSLRSAEAPLPFPEITSFFPTNGPPGTGVWIYGSNLWPVLAVKFGGAEASFLTMTTTGREILAIVPTNAFSGPISVVARGGMATTSGSFRVTQISAPIIQSFSPTVGKPGDRITVRGLNFTNVTAVQFNGLPGAFTELAGNIHVVVPTNATSGPVTVATQHGTTRSADSFTVLDPGKLAPVISDFFPKIGPPGTAVTLRGINLPGSTSVRFNGAEAFFYVFAFDLGATVPTNATSGPITVESAGGKFTTQEPFTVLEHPKPEIVGFRPESGAVGTRVEIFGTNLSRVSSVQFNGMEAPFVFLFGPGLSANVPANATSGPIRVTTVGGVATSARAFTVLQSGDVAVDAVPSPSLAVAGKFLTFTLQVTNRGPNRVTDLKLTNAFSQALRPMAFKTGYPVASPAPSQTQEVNVPGESLTNVTVRSVTSSQGTNVVQAGVLRFDLGELEAGGGATAVFEVEATARGILHNLIRIGAKEFDPELSNNHVVASVSVVATNELMIQPVGRGQLQLTWPVEAGGFVLEMNEALGGIPWVAVPRQRALLDGRWITVIDEPPGEKRFYRLRRND